jgi:hypothetical protein
LQLGKGLLKIVPQRYLESDASPAQNRHCAGRSTRNPSYVLYGPQTIHSLLCLSTKSTHRVVGAGPVTEEGRLAFLECPFCNIGPQGG